MKFYSHLINKMLILVNIMLFLNAFKAYIIYNNSKIYNYSTMVIQNDKIFIGANNYLLLLDKNLNIIQLENWVLDNYYKKKCSDIFYDTTICSNYIILSAMIDNTILFCGYNSRNPICTMRNPNNISDIIKNVSIKENIGPLNYKAKYNIINTRTDVILSGDFTDKDQSNNDIIVKIVKNNYKISFINYNNFNILNKPKIIYLYTIEDYIYFIFTEEIIYDKNNEYVNFNERISRIGRFCKNDTNKLISMEKFRLSCKQNYNNILNSIYYDNILYVIFYSDVYNKSIICLFSMAKIETTFNVKIYSFSKYVIIKPYLTYSIHNNPKEIIIKNKHNIVLGFDYNIEEYEHSRFLNYLVLVNNITIHYRLRKLILYENDFYALSNNHILKISSLNNNNYINCYNLILNIITLSLLHFF